MGSEKTLLLCGTAGGNAHSASLPWTFSSSRNEGQTCLPESPEPEELKAAVLEMGAGLISVGEAQVVQTGAMEPIILLSKCVFYSGSAVWTKGAGSVGWGSWQEGPASPTPCREK